MHLRGTPVVLLMLISSAAFAQSEWHWYGGNPGGVRYSSLKQISRSNVARLRRAWTYHTGEFPAGAESTPARRLEAFEATPLEIEGVLYFTTPGSRAIAVNAETGAEIWTFDAQSGRSPRRYAPSRGMAYWQGPKGERRLLYGTADGRLVELDARTGKPSPGFANEGVLDLRAGAAARWPDARYAITSPPAIYQDLVITGAGVPDHPGQGPAGDVRAFDVRTGKLVWTFHTVPQPGEPGHDTWEDESWKDRTGVNVWSIMSVDTARGLVFLPVGSPAYDFYGGDRHGSNLFADSLVALDAATGKLRWYYQMVHHDLWDYDLPAQPLLVSLRREGREIPAVAQVTKMGFVFVLDRLSGQPLFPVEERLVPHSDTPDEEAAPTQPVPLKPPALARQWVAQKDISTVTPESNSYCSELFRSLENQGMYTPFGRRLTLVMPGALGGGNWSGASFDASSGYLYVNINELGSVGAMEPQPEGSAVRFRRASKWGEYARFADPHGWPCQQPPWGTLNAVDLNKGQLAWRVPLGTVPELEARGLRNTGSPNLGGPMVTAGGLVFIAGTTDARFRAFDARTGKELWQARLEAAGHATPMTYTGRKSGKQYVVIAAGGGGFFPGKVSDVLAAYALPD